LRLESMICVRMKPGHSTDTPIPRGANSKRKPSDSATTMEAVETMWPPSPWRSMSGAKISIPQTRSSSPSRLQSVAESSSRLDLTEPVD
jgi:hypothetical protein